MVFNAPLNMGNERQAAQHHTSMRSTGYTGIVHSMLEEVFFKGHVQGVKMNTRSGKSLKEVEIEMGELKKKKKN